MSQTISVVQIRGKIPMNSSSGKKRSNAQTNKKLMTRLESPRVRIRIGKVRRLRRGFRIAFSIPRTSPAIKSSWGEPVNSTPVTNRVAIQSPAIPAKICKRSAWIIFCILLPFAQQVNLS